MGIIDFEEIEIIVKQKSKILLVETPMINN